MNRVAAGRRICSHFLCFLAVVKCAATQGQYQSLLSWIIVSTDSKTGLVSSTDREEAALCADLRDKVSSFYFSAVN